MFRLIAAVLAIAGLASAQMSTDQRIQLYERLLNQKPAETEYQIKLAEAFLQKTRETGDTRYVEKADVLAKRTLEATPGDYRALRVRNLVSMQRHEFDAVIKSARKLAEIAPRDAQNWGTLGDALMEMGMYGPAAEAYAKMLALRQDMFSYNREAWRKFVTGDANGAIAMMKDAVATSRNVPENKAWCLVELGNLYFKTGKLEEASKAYQQAIEVFPNMHSAHGGAGMVLAAQGKTAAAIESYRKAQQIVPMVQYAAALADLLSIAGKTDEAAGQLAMVDVTAKLEKAQNQRANRTLAMVYANHGIHLEEAAALAQADLDVRKDVYTWDAFAWTLYKNKKYKEAWMVSQQALRANTPEPLFYYHMGMIYHALGKPLDAAPFLEKALTLNPAFDPIQAPVAARTLTQCKSQAGQASSTPSPQVPPAHELRADRRSQ